jgi:23S rRNA (adenine2503-C2)-methyltransferase
MTDLGAAARDRLAPLLPTLLTRCATSTATSGATGKSLWRGHDGTLVESVSCATPSARPVCVSSQAGCGMGLPVLRHRSGRAHPQPVDREIVEQVVAAQRHRGGRGGRVSNVVFMGMGEPLANYSRVVAPSAASPTRRRTASASASAASSSRPSGSCRRSRS